VPPNLSLTFFFSFFQVKLNTRKKYNLSRTNNAVCFIGNKTIRHPGGGRPKKWFSLEDFIDQTVRYYWECGVPITLEQLKMLVQQHITASKDTEGIKLFIEGKRNTLVKYISHTLKRNHWSGRKNSISRSVPVDWCKKAEENSTRIREKFREEDVDGVVNADETFLLFHPFGEKLLAPTGAKRVGSAVQVDNEKWGATIMIACEYRTSSILPPMIIFTGVYCTTLMTQWAKYPKGNFADCFLFKFY
jgi:hypothetical protein